MRKEYGRSLENSSQDEFYERTDLVSTSASGLIFQSWFAARFG